MSIADFSSGVASRELAELGHSCILIRGMRIIDEKKKKGVTYCGI
jgi:hypothetical protein